MGLQKRNINILKKYCIVPFLSTLSKAWCLIWNETLRKGFQEKHHFGRSTICTSPHTYLMLDLKPDTDERFRVRSNILKDPQDVYIKHWKRKRVICKVTMMLSTCLRTSRKISLCWRHYIVLSKYRKKELLKHLKSKPDKIKAICQCVISIINNNIKLTDQEKRKFTKVAIRFENSWI